MHIAVEGKIDTNGIVQLSEPLKLPHACRAIITIIDDNPITEASLLSQQLLSEDWEKPEEDQAWSHLQ